MQGTYSLAARIARGFAFSVCPKRAFLTRTLSARELARAVDRLYARHGLN
jgi:hypothetical protein